MLRTYVMRGAIDTDLASDIYHLHLDAPLVVQEPTRAEMFATALNHGATAYDAVFISLALEADISLLTAERTTTPWVVKLGKRIVSVR